VAWGEPTNYGVRELEDMAALDALDHTGGTERAL
jgi:hypothetical protein